MIQSVDDPLGFDRTDSVEAWSRIFQKRDLPGSDSTQEDGLRAFFY
jgi:hypothetical protein